MSEDKQGTFLQAIERIPPEGATIAFGGVTLYRRPMAFSLALLENFRRTGYPKELTLISFTSGLESDILVEAGMVSKVRTCYFGLEGFGLAPAFTDFANTGRLEIIEETEASLGLGLRAALGTVGFMPSPAWQGTDLLKLRPDVKSIEDPYTGETLTAFPAIQVDLAILHAISSDRRGNASIGKNWGVDRELALVADEVFITSERIVQDTTSAEIFGPLVNLLIEAPRGAWPTSCHPEYPLDGAQLLRYIESYGTEDYPDLINEWMSTHRNL